MEQLTCVRSLYRCIRSELAGCTMGNQQVLKSNLVSLAKAMIVPISTVPNHTHYERIGMEVLARLTHQRTLQVEEKHVCCLT
eukprot:2884510-Amphidinium_carterae.3